MARKRWNSLRRRARELGSRELRRVRSVETARARREATS
jgi:hypothetical protein